MFPAETYIERRSKLQKQIVNGLILIPGNNESPMNYPDNPYPFRQDTSFLYYFGIDRPGLIALMDLDENRECIYGDDITVEDSVWMGPQTTLKELSEEVGVDSTEPLVQVAGTIKKTMQQGRTIHILPPYRQDTTLQLSELLGISPSELNSHISKTLIRSVVAQRSVKSPAEIEQIEMALQISYETQILAMQKAAPGLYERDIAGAMEGLVLAKGSRISFPTILTIHGHILHNH